MGNIDHKYISVLVVKTQNNDSNAFAELYALTYKKIYNYCYNYLKDTYLAQDAVQEIYILALKNISTLKDTELFVAWIRQISFHVCYDMYKKNVLNAAYNVDTETLAEKASPEQDPETIVEKKDDTAIIQHAINELSAIEQQVILMKYYNSMKLDEIATVLGCSLSTVKRHLANARINLVKLLNEKR